jgi:hypothetical protein
MLPNCTGNKPQSYIMISFWFDFLTTHCCWYNTRPLPSKIRAPVESSLHRLGRQLWRSNSTASGRMDIRKKRTLGPTTEGFVVGYIIGTQCYYHIAILPNKYKAGGSSFPTFGSTGGGGGTQMLMQTSTGGKMCLCVMCCCCIGVILAIVLPLVLLL